MMDKLKRAIFKMATKLFKDGSSLEGFEEFGYTLAESSTALHVYVGDREFVIQVYEQTQRW